MTNEIDRHKAPQAERDIAAYWAGLYRLAESSPDRKVRSEEGFADAPDGAKLPKGFVVHADDTERLISLLENFARYGTFQMRREGFSDVLTLLRVSLEFQTLVKGGMPDAMAWRKAEKKAGPESTYRRIKARVFGRHPGVIKEKSEKAKKIKARRQNRLSALDTAWGIAHPKG